MKTNCLFRFIAVCVVSLASLLFASPRSFGDPAEIAGAFGLRFGAVADPSILKETQGALSWGGVGLVSIDVSPPDPNPFFTVYSIEVDATTHKICRIIARGEAKGADQGLFEKFVQILTAKYGPPEEPYARPPQVVPRPRVGIPQPSTETEPDGAVKPREPAAGTPGPFKRSLRVIPTEGTSPTPAIPNENGPNAATPAYRPGRTAAQFKLNGRRIFIQALSNSHIEIMYEDEAAVKEAAKAVIDRAIEKATDKGL